MISTWKQSWIPRFVPSKLKIRSKSITDWIVLNETILLDQAAFGRAIFFNIDQRKNGLAQMYNMRLKMPSAFSVHYIHMYNNTYKLIVCRRQFKRNINKIFIVQLQMKMRYVSDIIFIINVIRCNCYCTCICRSLCMQLQANSCIDAAKAPKTSSPPLTTILPHKTVTIASISIW